MVRFYIDNSKPPATLMEPPMLSAGGAFLRGRWVAGLPEALPALQPVNRRPPSLENANSFAHIAHSGHRRRIRQLLRDLLLSCYLSPSTVALLVLLTVAKS